MSQIYHFSKKLAGFRLPWLTVGSIRRYFMHMSFKMKIPVTDAHTHVHAIPPSTFPSHAKVRTRTRRGSSGLFPSVMRSFTRRKRFWCFPTFPPFLLTFFLLSLTSFFSVYIHFFSSFLIPIFRFLFHFLPFHILSFYFRSFLFEFHFFSLSRFLPNIFMRKSHRLQYHGRIFEFSYLSKGDVTHL